MCQGVWKLIKTQHNHSYMTRHNSGKIRKIDGLVVFEIKFKKQLAVLWMGDCILNISHK